MSTKPSHPTGIDQSWGYAKPQTVADAGVQVVSMYLSNDTSKNVSANKVKAYHKATSAKCPHGVGVLLNWEAQAGGALLGKPQATKDATTAVQQVRSLIAAVGYKPKNQLSITFSCDRDTTSKDYPKTDAYYGETQRIVHAANFLNGAYAEFDLGNHLVAKKLIEVFWQTYAWSGGRLSPEADFYQYLNGQTLGGASVDFDQVVHPTKLGVWWPPGHPLNVALHPEDDMAAADVAAINSHTDATKKEALAAISALRKELDRVGGVIIRGDAKQVAGDHAANLNSIFKRLEALEAK